MSETNEREAVLKEFEYNALDHHRLWGIAAMADEIVRLRRILAALREPSLALLFAGQQAYAIKIGEIYADEGHVARHHQTLAIDSAIRAAVKAAEQEVGRE